MHGEHRALAREGAPLRAVDPDPAADARARASRAAASTAGSWRTSTFPPRSSTPHRSRPGACSTAARCSTSRRIPAQEWGRDILIENGRGANGIPTYRGIRTYRYLYVEHLTTGEYELYDLVEDPFQLDSKDGDDRYRHVERDLKRRLRTLHSCAGPELPRQPAAAALPALAGPAGRQLPARRPARARRGLGARRDHDRRRARGQPRDRPCADATGGRGHPAAPPAPGPALPAARAHRDDRRPPPDTRPDTARLPVRCSPRSSRSPRSPLPAAAGRRPAERTNIVVVMTDDQTLESMRVMSGGEARARGGGDHLRPRLRVELALLPVARHLFTGQYSHNHGVIGNTAAGRRLRAARQEQLAAGLAPGGGLPDGAHRQVPERVRPAATRPRCRPAGASGTRRSIRPPTSSTATR